MVERENAAVAAVEEYPPERPMYGIGLLLGAAVLFSLMIILVKAASDTVPIGQSVFFRFFIGLAAMRAAKSAGIIKFTPVNLSGLVLRGAFGGAAVFFYYMAAYKGSVTHAVLLNNSRPVFIALISAAYIGEKVRRRALIVPLTVAMIGLVLVVKPGPGGNSAADAMGLASGLCAAFAILTVRKLRRTESVWTVVYYFNLVGSIFSLPVMLYQFEPPTAVSALMILGIAFFSNAAQTLLTAAYRYTRASEGSVVELSQVVFSAIFAGLFFGEKPAAATLAGGALILFAVALLSRRGRDDSTVNSRK